VVGWGVVGWSGVGCGVVVGVWGYREMIQQGYRTDMRKRRTGWHGVQIDRRGVPSVCSRCVCVWGGGSGTGDMQRTQQQRHMSDVCNQGRHCTECETGVRQV
jgi:hypothetical protein